MDYFETKSKVVAVLPAIAKSDANTGTFSLQIVVFEEAPCWRINDNQMR